MREADKLLHKIGYLKEYEDCTEEVWNYENRFCINLINFVKV